MGHHEIVKFVAEAFYGKLSSDLVSVGKTVKQQCHPEIGGGVSRIAESLCCFISIR